MGNLGLTSIRTLRIEDLRKYVASLSFLASLSIAMRIAWVIDVVAQVQKAAKEDESEPRTVDKPKGGDENSIDDIDDDKLDGKAVITFTIQVTILLLCDYLDPTSASIAYLI